MILCALSLCVLPFLSSWSYGTLIYSDVSGANVNYTNIQEDPTRLSIPTSSEPAPTFGQPTEIGSLTFPALSSFKATSVGNALDKATGNLSITVTAKNNVSGISSITFNEFGDYSLMRLQNALDSNPSAKVTAQGLITVQEINGVQVPNFTLPLNEFTQQFNLTSGQTDGGAAWSGVVSVDVTQGVRAHYPTGFATKISFSLVNILTSETGASSISQIEKTQAYMTVGTVPVPEPNILVMLAIGVLGLGVWRRKT